MSELKIMEKDEFVTKFMYDQEQRKKEGSKMDILEEKKIKKIAPAVDKDGAKKEKKEINSSIEKLLKKEFEIKVQTNGEIFVRGLNADYSIKITQKKDRLSDFE